MSSVRGWMRERLPQPRVFLAMAALVATAGFVLGYVEVSRQADRVLALRQGPPAPVAIQSFERHRDLGPASELRIRAEADFARAIVLKLPGSPGEEGTLVVPLYPLSEAGAALIGPDAGAGAAAGADRGGDPRPAAVGMIVHPVAGPARQMGTLPVAHAHLAANVHGLGRNGTVVELNGLMTDPGGLGLMAAGAFTAMGIQADGAILAVLPFAGRREAILSENPVTGVARTLLFAAVLIAFAAPLSARVRQDRRRQVRYALDPDADDAPESRALDPRFQPIPSQREIFAASRRSERNDEPHLRSTLVATLGFLAQRFRSRLSRPEDGAL